MSAVGNPGTSSQHIESGRREKRLKPELLAAKVARLPHVTGPHRLRDRPLNPRSLGVELTKLRCFLTDASQIESLVTCFIWSQDQDFGCNRGCIGHEVDKSDRAEGGNERAGSAVRAGQGYAPNLG